MIIHVNSVYVLLHRKLFGIQFFFFFSSRRRHTRCSRDWSSDVCSSDLDAAGIRGPSSGQSNFRGKKLPRLNEVDLFVRMRSEEHTSELQSRLHLVCRLLLEKKKKIWQVLLAGLGVCLDCAVIFIRAIG